MFIVWNVVFLLVGSLSLGKTAPAATPPQDCETIITPLSLDNAQLSGRWNLIEGFSDSDDFKSILKMAQSSWRYITASPEDNSTLIMTHRVRINGTCHSSQAKMIAISDITIDVAIEGISRRFSLLSTCVNCLVLNFTTSVREIDSPIHHALFIFGRGTSLEESDLEVFRQQAKCLNFSLPASFHYNQEQEFCSADNMTAAVKKA